DRVQFVRYSLDSAWLARSSSFYTSINAHSKGHAVIVFTEDGEISGLEKQRRRLPEPAPTQTVGSDAEALWRQ
ncbi:hypothetical protein, partial [Acidovorax sp.]|uniref:hypothetical protein n=1 Tax=Acidovorax sp. TaxID=1872122 RepID=UPI00391FA250